MKYLKRSYNFIVSLGQGTTSFIFQVQYYDGKTFIRERHWGLGFGPWLPPFVILTEKVPK